MDAALTFLLDNVKGLLSNHFKLISGAENELKLLQEELELMKAFLEEASNSPRKEPLLKAWERQIREVVYEAEDTIDACITQANTSKAKMAILSSSKTSLAKQVKALREERVKPVFEGARNHFSSLPIVLGVPTSTGETIKDRRNNKNPRKDNVVGFEDETKILIDCLNEKTKKLDVLSIVGMPGLGKTTVAWKIYHDPRIQYEFPTLIWVCVSQELNKRDVFRTIIRKFTQQDMSHVTDDDLGQMVNKYLKTGKFIIFMDDVWTVEVWNELKQVLPQSNGMGKVLITSRHEDVAWHANPLRTPHKLRFLDEHESWELLQLEACGATNAIVEELEPIGKIIAKQCGGLPLSIIIVGGILIDKLSLSRGIDSLLREEWKKVSENVQACLLRDDKEKQMENIIALSYTKLPYHLRDCFLYLGMFPEDCQISASKLAKLWITEGFVQHQDHKCLEETAQDNLNDLITRNLMMVDTTKLNGEVKTCRVHDTIREFCKHEAGPGNQNILQEIRMTKEGVFDTSLQLLEKCRRHCIHSHVHEFFSKKPKAPKARSFFCHSKDPIILDDKDIPSLVGTFNLLRVFELSRNFKFPIRFPLKLTTLVHLRYLTLTGDEFKFLPKELSGLWNLQVLVVHTLSRTLEIKADIWHMIRLRHLKTNASIIFKKDAKGEGSGENLQTLGRLSPETCTEHVFTKAKNLSRLGIRGDLSTLLDSASCLEKLALVIKLKLVHDPKVSGSPLRALPQPNKFPPRMKTLVLSGTLLDWKYMSILGNIGTLEVLKLKQKAFMGESWTTSRNGFPNLEFLYIERTNLMVWTGSDDTFVKLKGLVLKNCEQLEGVPSGIARNLEMLEMELVTVAAVSSAVEIEKEKKQQLEGKQQTTTSRRRGFKLVIAPGDMKKYQER